MGFSFLGSLEKPPILWGYNVEFKVRVSSKVRELTEEICAFANADGGYLLIDVDDNALIIGTSLENDKRSAIIFH